MGWVKEEAWDGEKWVTVFQIGKDPLSPGPNDLVSGDPADDQMDQDRSRTFQQSGAHGGKL